jgi:hypothetical protein
MNTKYKCQDAPIALAKIKKQEFVSPIQKKNELPITRKRKTKMSGRLNVNFRAKVKIVKVKLDRYEFIYKNEITKLPQKLLDEHRNVIEDYTYFIPNKLEPRVPPRRYGEKGEKINQDYLFVNEEFGIIRNDTKLTYKNPYLMVEFLFDFQDKDKIKDVNATNIKDLIFDAFHQMYSPENYHFQLNLGYDKKLDADVYYRVEILDTPEDIQFIEV